MNKTVIIEMKKNKEPASLTPRQQRRRFFRGFITIIFITSMFSALSIIRADTQITSETPPQTMYFRSMTIYLVASTKR